MTQTSTASGDMHPRNRWIAALLSLALPGLGQLYNGELNKALWLFLGFVLIGCFPGVTIAALYVPSVLMLPLLTAVSDFVGLVGGFLVAYFTLRLGPIQFWTRAIHALDFGDLVQGLSKPFVFAFIISTVACFMGLRVKGGTQGVGRATTSAVVVSSVILLVTDTFITRILLWAFSK